MKELFFDNDVKTSNIDNFTFVAVTEENIIKMSKFRKEPNFILEFRLKH